MSPARETAAALTYSQERRSSRRYPVGMDLHYTLSRNQTVVKEGSGRTRDFSGSGVFFQTLQPVDGLAAGLDVELFVDWPSRINGKAVVTVSIVGHTVRCGADGIAVRIANCEVRAIPSSRKSRA